MAAMIYHGDHDSQETNKRPAEPQNEGLPAFYLKSARKRYTQIQSIGRTACACTDKIEVILNQTRNHGILFGKSCDVLLKV